MTLDATLAPSSPLTRNERVRRVLALGRDFIRNIVYVRGAQKYPAGWKEPPLHSAVNFYRTAHNNALDMCVLDWCKLFGDDKTKAPASWGKHFWGKIFSDPARFEAELLQSLHVSAADFEAYRVETRTYRDRFVAHLDSDRVAHISDLDLARRDPQGFFCLNYPGATAAPALLIMNGLAACRT